MLQLKPSAIVVYFSTTYSDFRLKKGNRHLNQAKINRIKNDILGGNDVLRYNPILVNNVKGEHLEILDGQHRYWVAKILSRPVHFIIADKNMDMYAIASVNSNTEKWKWEDYLRCYTELGNEHYEQLGNFLHKYKISYKAAIALLSRGTVTGTSATAKEFERGRFEVNYLQEATDTAEICIQFKAFPHYKDREFIIAICKIKESGKADITDLIDKFNLYPEMLTRQATYKEYLTNLETIYNHRRHSRRYLL